MFVNREEVPVYPIYRDPVSTPLNNLISTRCDLVPHASAILLLTIENERLVMQIDQFISLIDLRFVKFLIQFFKS